VWQIYGGQGGRPVRPIEKQIKVKIQIKDEMKKILSCHKNIKRKID